MRKEAEKLEEERGGQGSGGEDPMKDIDLAPTAL